MRTIRPVLTFFVGSAAFVALPMSSLLAQSPSKTLERAVTTYRAATTMRVQFDQTLSNPLTGSTLSSKGELLRKKPNLLSITFAEAKDRIVADGKILWVYLPSSAPGQVIKLPAGGAPGALIDPFGQVLTAPADKFDIADAGKAVIHDHATHAVTMTPKNHTESLFTKATVWIDDKDGTVRQIETTEPSGVTRQIVITKFAPNVTIPKSSFVFTPPADTRVVDGQPGQ